MARRKWRREKKSAIAYVTGYSPVNVTGEPIPIIHWEDGTVTAVPEEELPLRLPKTKTSSQAVLENLH